MSDRTSPQALAGALVLAGGYGRRGAPVAQDVGSARAPRAFTIAFSREVGAGGTSVATAVGQRLNWPVYDHALLERIAGEMKLRAQLLESVDERHVSWLRECMESFAAARVVSESSFVRHLIETVLSLGAHGECIIVGRGAAQILPAAATLRVRLVASLEDRITVMAGELRRVAC